MKRDMDLIRKMVLMIEDSPDGHAPQGLNVDGYSEGQIGYHSYLLVDAGLAVGPDVTHMGSSGPECVITHLTWAGHDFAAASRDESIWKRAKATIKDKVASVSFDVMKQLLSGLLKSALGLG